MEVGWRVTELRGSATTLHARQLVAACRLVDVLVIERPALVLGSTQRAEVVDVATAGAMGVEVVRRRSGGGAVLLRPDDLWVDVSIPRDDPLWDDDVSVSFAWLGEAWAVALRALGARGTVVHAGPARSTRWSRLVCFAGVGSGEVLVGDRKVVGISQRRTRDAARFQCTVPSSWDPVTILGLLDLGDDDRAAALVELTDVAAGAPAPSAEVLAAFLAALP